MSSAAAAAQSGPAAIAVEELRVRRGGRPVLHGVSFEVGRGSVTGLLGPSGCGKTTLMRAIVGVQIVESVTQIAVRPFRGSMDEPDDRIEEAGKLALKRCCHAMRHIAPVSEALHLLAPVLNALLQCFRRAAFVQHAADAGFRGIAADAREDASYLPRRNRGEDDDPERTPGHSFFFHHPR